MIQAGNSIGGAISDDGTLVAVSNYEPGGVRVFDAETLTLVADIPAVGADGKASKTVGLVDLPGHRFAYALYDAGEIWIADFSRGEVPEITRLPQVGKLPYDGNVTPDGRHYLVGLFGEDGVVHVDLWKQPIAAERILDRYGKGEEKLPVYKMPHLEGWAAAGDVMLIPAVGRHELLAVDTRSFREVGRVATHGQPVFAVARPDGRHVWVNFAHPLNDTVEVVDTTTMQVVHRLVPGPAVLHMEFTPRGHEVWVSVQRRRPRRRLRRHDVRQARRDLRAETVGHLLRRAGDEDRPMTLAAADLALVDRWQRGFPLVERPFAVVGESVGLDAAATIERLRSLLAAGAMSRIGAVVRPRSVGASTLAAMQVPIRHLDEVAAIVSAEPLVNHNYQREHDLNLWFVVAGGEGGAVATTLERISSRAGLPVVDLPLLQAYHLDLGFSLRDRRGDRAVAMRPAPDYRADARDRAVLAAIEDGLPLVERPYRAVGRAADLGEAEVIDRLAHLAATGVISRFGCIVRHRAFGYVANAMTVWNVPDGDRRQCCGELRRQSARHLVLSPAAPATALAVQSVLHGARQGAPRGIGDDRGSQRPCRDGSPRSGRPVLDPLLQAARRRVLRPIAGAEPMSGLDATDRAIVNALQGGFPLTSRPFRDAGIALGLGEDELIDRIRNLAATGRLSRFGPLWNAEALGGDVCLCAMAVPPDRFDEVAAAVNAHPEIAHNYARDHALNMWFVVSTERPERIGALIGEIERETGLAVHAMPKLREFFVGFRLEV